MVEHSTWESLVLPDDTKSQLRQLQAIVEDPESARRFGIDPPSGLLLAGPPGTGKTTVAKVIAAQARCSFYPVSGADVMSKWVGESEGNLRRLFERARENRPSVIFIDEIDAIAARRGEFHVHDTQVNQLLSEIDGVAGQRGVFVIGATNRPDQLDPALLRGGRLSRTIVLGLPDERGRLGDPLPLHVEDADGGRLAGAGRTPRRQVLARGPQGPLPGGSARRDAPRRRGADHPRGLRDRDYPRARARARTAGAALVPAQASRAVRGKPKPGRSRSVGDPLTHLAPSVVSS
jgi:ATPase family protein associated with various cellular activities (AAA)